MRTFKLAMYALGVTLAAGAFILALPQAALALPPSQLSTYFESFENAAENTAADARDCNRNGRIDCGQDNNCATATDACPSNCATVAYPTLSCDEQALRQASDPNLRLANEANLTSDPNLVYFKTDGVILPASRGTAEIVEPFGTSICPADRDNGSPVTGVRPDLMSWHIHTVNTPDIDGTDTSKPGSQSKAFRGQNSLHWGRHVEVVNAERRGRSRNKARVFGDTYCLQCMNAFVLDKEGGLNMASRGTRDQPLRLSFWHIAEFCDGECYAAFALGVADELGAVEVRHAAIGSDAFSLWERAEPDLNPYEGVQDTAYFTATYEPTDDINLNPPAGDDPSNAICAPLTVYIAQGSAKGTDPGCGDGDGNGFGDCGKITGGTARGETGVGVWALTSFNLSRYAGQRIQARFLTTTLDGRDLFTSYLETTSGPFFAPSTSVEDGWYIDDIRVSGLAD